MAPKNPVKRTLEFKDNSLLPALLGPNNEHLITLERKLNVSIFSFGNILEVSGGDVDTAVKILEGLYERLQKNMPVTSDEVSAALRMVQNVKKVTPQQKDDLHPMTEESTGLRTKLRTFTARSPNQASYIEALKTCPLVIGLGPAGTGKTFLAVAAAVQMMIEGIVDRIILSRPAVEAGERLGFLPGDLREKIDPYLRPLYDSLYMSLPAETVVKKLANGEIEVAPLAFMRGRTLTNAFVILDEAQNTTSVQMKMFLTRLGDNSRMVLTGDLGQVDLPKGVRSGLRDAVDILEGVEDVSITRFDSSDVVRHPLVSRIIDAYDTFERQNVASAPYKQ